MKKLASFLLVLALLAWVPNGSIAQESSYRVIVNKANPADSISKSTLSGYLLKKTSRWDDGTPMAPVDLASGSPVREAFSRDVHGRSVSSIKNYWQRQIFSGRDTPPPELSNDAAVIAFVESRPGAIGYVSAQASVSSVKEISVFDG